MCVLYILYIKYKSAKIKYEHGLITNNESLLKILKAPILVNNNKIFNFLMYSFTKKSSDFCHGLKEFQVFNNFLIKSYVKLKNFIKIIIANLYP